MDKDVRRIDSSHPFYAGEGNPNTETLRQILLTYSMYNFDLGYCQVELSQELAVMWNELWLVLRPHC